MPDFATYNAFGAGNLAAPAASMPGNKSDAIGLAGLGSFYSE